MTLAMLLGSAGREGALASAARPDGSEMPVGWGVLMGTPARPG